MANIKELLNGMDLEPEAKRLLPLVPGIAARVVIQASIAISLRKMMKGEKE